MSEKNNSKLNEASEGSLGILIKTSVKETCLESTIAGIPNIFKNGNHVILRIIWLICFLCCTGVSLWFVYGTITQFMSNPTYVDVQINQEVPTNFPMVTFCNMKLINFSSPLIKTYLNKTFDNWFIPVYPEPSYEKYNITSLHEWSLGELMLLVNLLNNDPSGIITNANRKSFGYQIEDMLVSCYFNYKPCYATDFTYVYDLRFGNCYTFNGGVFSNGTTYSPKQVNLDGRLYGLTLELYLGDPNNTMELQPTDGIYLTIQNQSSKPLWSGDPFTAPSAAETDFILKRNFVTNLPSPYTNCTVDGTSSSYYKYFVSPPAIAYNDQYCIQLCLQDQVLSNCFCRSSQLPVLNASYNSCKNANELRCTSSTQSNVTAIQSCQNSCPVPCNYTEFDVFTTRATYPNYLYNLKLDKYLLINKGIKQAVNGTPSAYSKINIYYHNMKYKTTIMNPKMQASDFVSNFGGTVGLYNGFSILSLAEVIEIIFNISFILITYLVNKRHKTRIDSFPAKASTKRLKTNALNL